MIYIVQLKTIPFLLLLQVDGAYALVNFSDKDGNNETPKDVLEFSSVLKNCRLVRKDELQVSKLEALDN